MFDHVTIRVADRVASEAFYKTLLGALRIELTSNGEIGPEWDDFSFSQATPEKPVTQRLHVGFVAPAPAYLEAFHVAGLAAGGRDDGAPGPRPAYGPDYRGAFLLDLDGNSVEAAFHDDLSRDGGIDHLWVRVADVAASRAFYDTIAPHAGLRRVVEEPGLVRYRGPSATGGSLTLLEDGPPTANVHLAFAGPDHATVEAFHAAATAAGHRSDGEPGERPHYHPGYYAAFVLDPDGNSVELVDHGR